MRAPSDEAWAYFMLHHDNIRRCIEDFSPRPWMQTMTGALPMTPVPNHLAKFDAAVVARDTVLLSDLMNDAWLRAPEDRSVYRVEGFTEMCNLLDETVEGFVPDEEETPP